MFRGKPHKLIALSILVLVCRRLNFPLTVRRILQCGKLKKKKAINKVLTIMKLLLPAEYSKFRVNPMNFLRKIVKQLDLRYRTVKLAGYIMRRVEA